jgi:hypothetical protein
MRTLTNLHLTVKRRLALLSFLLLGAAFASLNAQTANTYVFTTSTGAALDAMAGASTAIGASVDDTPSALLDIGFGFMYETTTYTQFSVSPDGFMKLGAPAATAQFTNSITSTTNIPKLFPYWDDLATGTTGNVTYVVNGTAPNRVLVVQWFVTIPRNTTGPANSTMQAWLYETTNVIEFRYGSVGGNSTSASNGINGTTATNFHSITTTTHTSSTTTANNSNTVWPGSGRMYTFTPPAACAGTPMGGTTNSSANPACSGVNFTLSLSGNTQGLGIAYQWQSSPDGFSYSDISGATSSTLTTNQTTATWYQCVVTCDNSGQSANSTELFVDMALPTQCYCTPVYTTGCGSSDRIDKVTFGVLVNPASGNSGCTNNNGLGYNQYLSGLPVPNLGVGGTYPISVLVGPGGTEHVKIFIDLNQDGDFFDAGEETYIGSGNGVTINGNVTIPAGALTGQTRMRVRVVFNTSTFGPCTSHSFGEAEDYLVNIVAPPSCLAGPNSPANGSTSCPGATTLSWPAEPDATSYDVYFGNSPNPPLVANTAGTSYNAGALGLGTYYWKIVPKNAAGDAAGCPEWSFTYADDEAPNITDCGSDQTLFADANCQAVLGNYTDNVSYSDNCPGAVTVTQSPNAGTVISANTIVTFTVQDIAGNSSICSVNVALEDNTAPTINCPAVIEVGTSNSSCDGVATFSVTADDNCDNNVTINQTNGPTSGSVFPLGITSVSFSAQDDAGNEDNCSFDVIVSDDDAPSITTCPPNVAVTTDENCEVLTDDYTGLVVADDNCGNFTITQSPAPGTISGGFLTIVMTATDDAGNASTCSFQTTADDMTPPTISCPDPQEFNADDDCQTPLPDFTSLADASDNCGGFVVTQSPAAGTLVGFGQTLVTLTVTDGPGLTASCVMEAYSVDVTPPVVTCPPSVTLNTDPNTCTAVAMFMCPVAPDNCSGSSNPEQILGLPSGSAFPLGVNVVGFQATDASGNSASCTFTITVEDNDPPYLSCPFDVVTNTDPGLCSAVVNWSEPTTHDNCDVPTLIQTGGLPNGSAFPKGVSVISYQSTDNAGNSTTCSFSITVNDNELPAITCPANITVGNTPNQCGAIVNYAAPTFSDNCPGATIALVSGLPSGAFFPVGTTTNVWQVTDASGNTATCSFTVTVNDVQPPTITCPANIVRNNDPDQCGAIVTYPTPTFSDNCPGVTIEQIAGLPSGSFFPVGTTTNVFKATDAADNMATCSFTVTVNDVQPPVFNNCPANITVVNDPGVCGAVVTWPKITASDNCPGVVVTFVSGMASGSLFDVGVTTVVYKATDASGNMATCSFTVTVLDNENPTIICPANISRGNDYNKCSATITFLGTAMAMDNCDVSSVTNDAVSNVYPVGVTTVTWTAVDAAGNDVTCQQTITVVDFQYPTLICPDDIYTVNDPNLPCQAEVDYEATVSDNCPGVTLEYSEWPPSENGLFSIGTTMVMATATDAAGNSLMCNFNIIVEPGVEICNGLDDDCDGYTDESDDAWRQTDKELASNGAKEDFYGTSVSISGTYAVVGAKNSDVDGENSGTAYILLQNENNADDWQQVAILDAPGVQANDLFGASVAVNGDWVVVGAPQDGDLGDKAGAAYIFRKGATPTTWDFVKKLTASDGFAGDNFGSAVSVFGNNILVGASMNDEKGLNAGAAYIFGRNQGGPNAWGQVKKITATDAQAGDMFGASVEIYDNHVVVGAPTEDEKGTNAGAAYLFAKDQGGTNAWGQVKKLMSSDGAPFDNFGASVGISSTVVIVGANLDDDRGANSGAAFLFERNHGGADNWGQAAKLLANDATASDQLGFTVAVTDEFAVVGARFDNIKGTNSGAAYIWERQQNGHWELVSKIHDTQGTKNDQFASALDIHQRVIIVGALKDDIGSKGDQGSVSFFAAGCDDDKFHGNPADIILPGDVKQVSAFSVNAYPQPFSDVLNIEINVKSAENARVVVWNTFGQEVATIYNGALEGVTTLRWNAEGLSSGTYFLRVEADNETEVKSILLIR